MCQSAVTKIANKVGFLVPMLSIHVSLNATMILVSMSREFGNFCIGEQRRLSRLCANAQTRQRHRCSLTRNVDKDEDSGGPNFRPLVPLYMYLRGGLKEVIAHNAQSTKIKSRILVWAFKGYCCAYELSTRISHSGIGF